jgi:hypothetical protein
MRETKKQAGYSVFEMLLFLVIICFVFFIGYYIRNHNGSSQTIDNTTTSKAASTNDTSTIVKRARYIINQDVNNHSGNHSEADAFYTKGYFSQSLLAYIQQNQFVDIDLINCSQDPANSYTYGIPSLSNNDINASLVITGNYRGSGPANITTNWIKVNSIWEENAIVCPSAQQP